MTMNRMGDGQSMNKWMVLAFLTGVAMAAPPDAPSAIRRGEASPWVAPLQGSRVLSGGGGVYRFCGGRCSLHLGV
jgi:hypothetical protein